MVRYISTDIIIMKEILEFLVTNPQTIWHATWGDMENYQGR